MRLMKVKLDLQLLFTTRPTRLVSSWSTSEDDKQHTVNVCCWFVVGNQQSVHSSSDAATTLPPGQGSHFGPSTGHITPPTGE